MNDRNQIEQYLRENLIGQRIEDVTLYLVNEQAFDDKDCDRQLADGGIQLQLSTRGAFTFGWDSNYELMNIAFEPCSVLCANSTLQALSTKGDFFWKQISGRKIQDIEVKWNWFDVEKKRHHVPIYLIFEMEDKTKFMICAMEFEKKENELCNFTFDQEGWIVVYFDKEDMKQLISSAAQLIRP